jgi:hypothetical protein
MTDGLQSLTYAELLERGTIDEIADKLIEMVIRERNYLFKGYAHEWTRAALAEFFERGTAVAKADAEQLAAVRLKGIALSEKLGLKEGM